MFFPCLCLGLFISYICDLLLIFSLVFTVINHIMSLKQTHWVFLQVLEYLLLFLDDNVDEENESFSNSECSASEFCLAFASFFANFSLALLIKVLLRKKACISVPSVLKNQLEPLRCKSKLKFMKRFEIISQILEICPKYFLPPQESRQISVAMVFLQQWTYRILL